MELHEKLIRLRKQKGMSQLELAEILDVSRQAISKWEVGAAVPSTENLRGLSNLYGVSLDYLVGDKDFDSPLEVHADETELIGSSIPDDVEVTRKRRLRQVLAVIACIWLCVLIFGILRHAILAAGLFIIGTAIPLITFMLLSKMVSYIWRKFQEVYYNSNASSGTYYIKIDAVASGGTISGNLSVAQYTKRPS